MKKIFGILIIVFAISLQTMAQVDYSFGYIKKKRDFKNVPTIGIKGGITLYSMHFSDANYNDLPGKYLLKPGYGIFVEYDVNIKNTPGFTIGAELMAVNRGYTKEFVLRPGSADIQEIDKLDAKYIDLRIPFGYRFYSDQTVNPYIFAAPYVGFCYGGAISKEFPNGESTDQTVDISQSDAVINPLDAGVILGAGIRFNIKFDVFSLVLKLDGSYNFGLMNTYSKTDGVPADLYAYTFTDDSRNNRGFEFMLSLGLPLKFNFLHDACHGW